MYRGEHMSFFKLKKINLNNIPKHVAIIMDGNGRWAIKRGLPRIMGHKVGVETLFSIVEESKNIGIEVISVYAFSTENWSRSKEEINYIFNLLESTLKDREGDILKKNIKVRFMGDIDILDKEYPSLKKRIERITEISKDNAGITLNIAFNYGSKTEIVSSIKKIASDVKDCKLSVDDINENLFETYLMTNGLPQIDLMIRTSGEKRLSNFLLWQLAYSEMIFTPIYWPDFKKEDLKRCILEYQKRDRRFGKIK